MSKELKTRVVRVTEKEERLLNFVRRRGHKVVSEINSAFVEIPDKENFLNMKGISSILEDRCFMSLDTLIDMKFISENQAEILVSALQKNKNIIIVGQIGTGKTTLLNSLIEYQTNARITVIEKVPELFISELQKDNKLLNVEIEVIESNTVSFEVLTNLLEALKHPARRIVYDELWGTDYRLSLLTALGMGISVLSTDHVNKKDWKPTFVDRFEESSRGHILATLNNHKFTIVTVGKDSVGRRRVLSIEEE